jgi:thiamine biosynthesis lipoprotein
MRRESTAMNSFVTITVYDDVLSPEKVNAAIDLAFTEIRRIEEMATDYNDTSQVGRINLRAGVDSVHISSELASLITTGLVFAGKSGGAFDIAVGPIVKTWDFLAANPRVPSGEAIASLLPLIDYHRIAIAGETVFLEQRGMSLDLGGIAKGYAVDRAVETLRRQGCTQFIVDLGGNLGVSWEGTRMLDSTAATILIRHPRKEGEFFGEFRVGTGGVSTSGDYQRYFMQEGVRYHHIIDPATGRPVSNGVVSVTIVAADATTADALSTLVFVLGRDEGLRFIQSTPGVEGLIVFLQNDTLSYEGSPDFEHRFSRSESYD